MKYLINDSDGNPIQWVNDETISELPLGAVALTDLEWEQKQMTQTEAERIASETFQIQQESEKQSVESKKAAILDRLGITAEEAKLLLS